MEQAEGSIVVDAPLEDIMEVIEDYESYPQWADVRTVDVRQRGEGGRATEVAFEVDVPALGKAAYTLQYRYAPGDTGVSCGTKVTYRLGVELGVLVPGFLRTEGGKLVIENALEKLKRRVEMG